MNDRRSFLRGVSAFSATTLFATLTQPAWSRNLDKALRDAEHLSPEDLASEEDFWYYIQQSFTSIPGIISLNNAGVSPAPKTVQDAMKRYYDMCNEDPSLFLNKLGEGKQGLRRSLAAMAGCSAEEIAVNRNSSEGLETIIYGLQLKAGDEVVASIQDYPNMINAWKQREMREGIKMVWINLDIPSEDESYFIDQYVKAFSARTKVVHITHMINWNGQILPVSKIAKEAHKRGIEVVVDGAQSFAHIKFTIPELGADYFAASLHKWLFAPVGTGLLYVKKEKIKNLYPLFATNESPLKDDIRKFEHLGTRPVFIEQAINKAIEFHDMIGIERKEKRLHYLKNYWMERLKEIPGISINTSFDPKWACAIGQFSIKGKEASSVINYLYANYRIHAVNGNWEKLKGVRVSPSVFTTIKELDVFVDAVRTLVKT
jgi:selenocysteine lyase/cysteine desulfurase